MELTLFPISKVRHHDPDAHEPGCMSDQDDPQGSDLAGYIDLFCSCHRYTEPKVLSNGTDIAWPAGWSEQQAENWRALNGLTGPASAGLAQL